MTHTAEAGISLGTIHPNAVNRGALPAWLRPGEVVRCLAASDATYYSPLITHGARPVSADAASLASAGRVPTLGAS